MEQIINAIKQIEPHANIVILNDFNTAIDKLQLGLVFADLEDCEIVRTKAFTALLNPAIDIHDDATVLGLTSTNSPRLQLYKKSELNNNVIPLAAICDNKIQLAIPKFAESKTVGNIIASSLPVILKSTKSVSPNTREADDFCTGVRHVIIKRKQALERELASDRASAEKYVLKAQQYTSIVQEKEALLSSLTAADKNNTDHLAHQTWTKIQSMVPRVFQSITADNHYVRALTHPISISGVMLGTYKILIGYDTLEVTAFREPEVGDTQHPHVDRSGRICWGNMSSIIGKLRANSDIQGLLNAAVMLLNTYNPADAWRKLTEFGEGAVSGTGYPSCREHSLRGEHILHCRTCLNDRTVTHSCNRRNTPSYIYDACYNEGFSPELGCASCTDENCPHYNDRFSRCYSYVIGASNSWAYCLLRCQTECSYINDASKQCERLNKTAIQDNGCPVIDNCRQPCQAAKKAKEDQ